jgi:hypothetical protein
MNQASMIHRARPLQAPSVLLSLALTTFSFTAQAQSDGAPAPNAAAEKPWEEARKPNVGPGVALAVLAAGGIGTGIAFQVASAQNRSSASSLSAMLAANHGGCSPLVNFYSTEVCPELQAKLNTADTLRDASVGPFILGGAAAASAAIYLLWPAPPDSKRSAGPAVALGVLAAGAIGAGVAFQVEAASYKSSASALATSITSNHGACNPLYDNYDFVYCPVLLAKSNASTTFQGAATGAFIAGGAAAGGAAVYLLWPSPRAKTAAPTAARSLRLAPMLGTGNGLLVSGQF